ncbi:hypothetical protein HDV06_006196 [Boothiomyces sp. JEL0866]|nr:hypothetical protein HDV06_006196 [Boothiomyces sp. JEL0866]
MQGSLSDKYGRRPVLLVSMLGNALSMILWIFGDSFILFVWSRIIGGLTEGNVQMSIAMISDISTEETRSRSLALVGICFAVGFSFGPPIGAYFTSIDLKTLLPDWPVNQYSTPALFALVLITIETVYMYFYLPETLVKKDEQKKQEKKAKSIFNLSVIHFLFLFVYSGMEFTLTFLTFDRFNFSNKQQGRLLGFIGIFTALVQGGYVRRIRNSGMEKSVVFNGVVACAIGLFIIGTMAIDNSSIYFLYIGSIFLSFTSGTVVTCLTSLASQTTKENKGKVLGYFRASGQLGRCLGPMTICLLYWIYGSYKIYLVGSIWMIFVSLIVYLGIENVKIKKD